MPETSHRTLLETLDAIRAIPTSSDILLSALGQILREELRKDPNLAELTLTRLIRGDLETIEAISLVAGSLAALSAIACKRGHEQDFMSSLLYDIMVSFTDYRKILEGAPEP